VHPRLFPRRHHVEIHLLVLDETDGRIEEILVA
jgi:hypothetical protein